MIAFVIPAHDEALLLGGTLVRIHAAAAACDVPYDLVVVDDASNDTTTQVAAEHGARVVRVEHRHIAAARNAGAHATTAPALVFVDADTHIDATVLSAALRALESGAVGGGAAVHLGGRRTWYERIAVPLLVRVFRMARIAPGCFLFCTRAAFERAGGFDERFYAAEDVALSRALARQGRFVLLRERVYTSDRKLRTFSAREHFAFLLRFALRGRGLLRSREGLELWYGARRLGSPAQADGDG